MMSQGKEYKESDLGLDNNSEKDIRKIYIKNYGNLTLELIGSNEIGVEAWSEKRNEELFIPWTSIIFISKIKEEATSFIEKAIQNEQRED